MRLFRRLVVRLFGPPVCRSCWRHGLPCIQRCGRSDDERIATYLDGGHGFNDA